MKNAEDRRRQRLDRQWQAHQQQRAAGVEDPGKWTRDHSRYTAWFTFDRHPILVMVVVVGTIVFAAFCVLVWMGVGYS
jgi:hypothetical protein